MLQHLQIELSIKLHCNLLTFPSRFIASAEKSTAGFLLSCPVALSAFHRQHIVMFALLLLLVCLRCHGDGNLPCGTDRRTRTIGNAVSCINYT